MHLHQNTMNFKAFQWGLRISALWLCSKHMHVHVINSVSGHFN